MYKINTDALLPGMIWHVRGYSPFSKLIRKALNARQQVPRCWGSHDALVINISSQWFIGDSAPVWSKLTPISKYQDELNSGAAEVRVYWPNDTAIGKGVDAAVYWTNHILGTPYDFSAFPRLLFKATVGDLSTSKYKWLRKIGDISCGHEWANWCTEGCSKSWKEGAGLDIWAKPNPTPYTTEKRAAKAFKDVTSEVIIHADDPT